MPRHYRCPQGCAPSWTMIDGRERFTHEPHCPEPGRDGWIEALLGARLAMLARLGLDGISVKAAQLTYGRWAQLYQLHVGDLPNLDRAGCGPYDRHGPHALTAGRFCVGNLQRPIYEVAP